MDTIKLSIFSYFDDFCCDGVSYVATADMHDYYTRRAGHTFVGFAEVDETPKDEIVKMATEALDKEIIDLQVQITQKEEKKKQLLAIEYKGEV